MKWVVKSMAAGRCGHNGRRVVSPVVLAPRPECERVTIRRPVCPRPALATEPVVAHPTLISKRVSCLVVRRKLSIVITIIIIIIIATIRNFFRFKKLVNWLIIFDKKFFPR